MFQLPPSFLLEDVDQSVKYFTMRDICRQEAKHYRMTFFRGRVMITNERYPGRIKRAGAPQRMVHWSNQKHYSGYMLAVAGTWHDRLRQNWGIRRRLHETNGVCLPSAPSPIEHQVRAATIPERQFDVLRAFCEPWQMNNTAANTRCSVLAAAHPLGLPTQPRLLQQIQQIIEDLRRIDRRQRVCSSRHPPVASF